MRFCHPALAENYGNRSRPVHELRAELNINSRRLKIKVVLNKKWPQYSQN
jgi:hypothetical protein